MTLSSAWRRRSFLQRCTCAIASVCLQLVVAPAFAGEVVADLRIVKRRIENSPRTLRVKAGDIVELHWTSDEATTVHLHGYQIEVALRPGTPSLMRFEARATGRFPLTAHGFGAGTPAATTRESVLLYLEVHPR